jgi:hypothetical protein
MPMLKIDVHPDVYAELLEKQNNLLAIGRIDLLDPTTFCGNGLNR